MSRTIKEKGLRYTIVFILFISYIFSVDDIINVNGVDVASGDLILKLKYEYAPLLGLEDPKLASEVTGLDETMTSRRLDYSFVPVINNYQTFGNLHYIHQIHQYYLLSFDNTLNIEGLAADLSLLNEIERVEYNGVFKLHQANDPGFPYQWGHQNLGDDQVYISLWDFNLELNPMWELQGNEDCDADISDAWEITTGTSEITVAMIDALLYEIIPDLEGKIISPVNITGENESTFSNIGFDHAISTSSLVAAIKDNNWGIAGVCPECNIMPINVAEWVAGYGFGIYTNSLANGIEWAINNGANVINMSLGFESYSELIDNQINMAFESNITCISTTGNDNIEFIEFPASATNCIAVGGSSPCNERYSQLSCEGWGTDGLNYREQWPSFYPTGSNYGAAMDIIAPGTFVTVDQVGYPAIDFMNKHGTSFSAPYVSGIAALLLSQNPTLSPVDIRQIITTSSVDVGDPGFDIETGWGVVNAYNALTCYYDAEAGSCYGKKGDINLDDSVDILDLVILTDFVLGYQTPDPYEFWAGDVNDDSYLTIEDLTTLVDFILNGEWPLGRNVVNAENNVYLSINPEHTLQRDGDNYFTFTLNNDEPVRAMHFELSSLGEAVEDIIISEDVNYMTLANNISSDAVEIIIYGQEGQTIPPGQHDICILYFNGTLNRDYSKESLSFQGVFVNDQKELLHLGFDQNIYQSIPEEFTLYSSYPNPFNNSLTIKLGVPEDGKIIVSVFDLTGKKIETLNNGYYTAGIHEFNWSADGYSSGLYFLMIGYNGKIFTSKIMLLK